MTLGIILGLAVVGLIVYLVFIAQRSQAASAVAARAQKVSEQAEQSAEQRARAEHDVISADFEKRRQGDIKSEIAEALKRDAEWPGKPSS